MIIDIICLISNIKRRTLQSAHMSCVWKVRRHVHFGFTMFGWVKLHPGVSKNGEYPRALYGL
jgi:hypothetical protein